MVALGLAGAEAGAPPEPFAPWFDRARAAGLHSAPHAGEHAGAESVWGAIRALGAERIGHGVRAVEDPALVAYLAEHRIPLDVCPLSNVRLGVASSLERHPLPSLLDAGVVVTLNSDDPALFNTSLSDDYATLVEPFGLSVEQIDEIVLNGFRSSFLPADRKQALVAEVQRELAALKQRHLSAVTTVTGLRSRIGLDRPVEHPLDGGPVGLDELLQLLPVPLLALVEQARPPPLFVTRSASRARWATRCEVDAGNTRPIRATPRQTLAPSARTQEILEIFATNCSTGGDFTRVT